jgi:prolyl oligopeptidase
MSATDSPFGLELTDPFRGLEDTTRPSTGSWAEAHSAETRRALDSVPGAASIRARLKEIVGDVSGIVEAVPTGNTVFYLRQDKGAPVAKLCMRTIGGTERVLFEPESSSRSTISTPAPSFDGRFVVFGVADGSEDHELQILDVTTGKPLPERIAHIRAPFVSWQSPQGGSSRAFYYSRFPSSGANEPGGAQTGRVFLHVLGSDPRSDQLVVGANVLDSPPVAGTDVPRIQTVPGSPFELTVVDDGASSDPRIYARRRPGPWKPVVTPEDAVASWVLRDNELYVLTRRKDPRGEIRRLSFDGHSTSDSRIQPSPGKALTSIAATHSALYVLEQDVTGASLRRVDFNLRSSVALSLPFSGSVSDVSAAPNGSAAFLQVDGWTQSSHWLRIDDAAHGPTDAFPEMPVLAAPNAIVEHLRARSKHGTLVPLTLMYQGPRPNLDAPVILLGYGAYEVSMLPNFNPARLAWLERGGVFAVAHVRGGGELGREWHLAGMRERKQNSIDDFIACAEQLVHSGYAKPEHLAAAGQSAGGLLVGMAIVQRPDLFRAAYVVSGILNLRRFLIAGAGPANVDEFGSVDTPSGLRGVLSIDPYENIKDSVPYPAVLVTAGMEDPRVPWWQGAKFVARLGQATSSHRPALFLPLPDSGHGNPTMAQVAEMIADQYTFLLWQLGALPAANADRN